MRDEGVMLTQEYTHKLLGCAYNVHTALGPGLLESVYEAALAYELQSQGFSVKRQMPVEVIYKEVKLSLDLRLDIIVDDSIILELKSVSDILPVHHKQLLTYLRLTGCKLGYLINFNVESLRDGICRVVNHL